MGIGGRHGRRYTTNHGAVQAGREPDPLSNG
jgi:hypothetical protein